DDAEFRVIARHKWQSVVRYPAAQMMDVMNTNIGGEPAQDARQIIIRATVERHLVQVPNPVASPLGILELVLDIEQPHSDRSREQPIIVTRSGQSRELLDRYSTAFSRGNPRRERNLRT